MIHMDVVLWKGGGPMCDLASVSNGAVWFSILLWYGFLLYFVF